MNCNLGFCRIGALVLCSYSTLPLYALVTQMGSHMKKSIFDEQTSKALHKWHMAVKKKQEERASKPPPSRTLGGSSKKSSLKRYASGPSLHRFMTMGHLSRTSTYDGHDGSRHEDSEHSTLANLIVRVDQGQNHDDGETEMSMLPIGEETRNGDDIQPVQPNPK
uniref:MLO-like protein n=1 Tax=Opuntia streptacantha TaxID=393608 RepID=A0A7C9ADH3_OPUST